MTLPAQPDLAGTPGTDGPWTMIVESIGSPRDGKQVATLRTLEDGAIGFRLAATLPRYPPIETGRPCRGRRRIRPSTRRPVRATTSNGPARGAPSTRGCSCVLDRSDDPATALESVRRGAGDLLTRVLPEPEAGLAAGILIGLRDRVDRTVAAYFTTAGVSHVVAISGWNIAIVAAAIATSRVDSGVDDDPSSPSSRSSPTSCFAGASASVLRAGADGGVVLLAREIGPGGRAAAALGWAVALLLVADPRLVGDAGFQLSSLATAGLIAWATPTRRTAATDGLAATSHAG